MNAYESTWPERNHQERLENPTTICGQVNWPSILAVVLEPQPGTEEKKCEKWWENRKRMMTYDDYDSFPLKYLLYSMFMHFKKMIRCISLHLFSPSKMLDPGQKHGRIRGWLWSSTFGSKCWDLSGAVQRALWAAVLSAIACRFNVNIIIVTIIHAVHRCVHPSMLTC